MINNMIFSLSRVTVFWYLIGILFLFMGAPQWAESRLDALQVLPWVPEFETTGITTAAKVQWTLLMYWTGPLLIGWLAAIIISLTVCEIQFQLYSLQRKRSVAARGEYYGVTVHPMSLGALPEATTPKLEGAKVSVTGAAGSDIASVTLQGKVKDAFSLLTAAETKFCEEVIQILLAKPDHYAGLGHGVGLLEHTFNVVSEAAPKCTPEFRLPLLAALCHDIGKLITFIPDGDGGWNRRGLHSRESARIIATLPSFQGLPQTHRLALILAIKYDHNPNKMPDVEGNKDASMLATRVISALAHADRQATAAEKDRHLERIQPEDILWKDFVDYLRDAPVVQLGKPGVANQINNPSNSEYLYVYEAAWRDAAIKRMPDEVAAALDLTRRDAGKLAKYTKVLASRLRKDGLLLEVTNVKKEDGTYEPVKVTEDNPLWDIRSGTGEKAQVIRGVLVLKADPLWTRLNFKLGVRSPYPVHIVSPNSDPDGRQKGGRDKASMDAADAAETMKVSGDDPSLYADATKPAAKMVKRRSFGEDPVPRNDEVMGLTVKPAPPKTKSPAPATPVQQEVSATLLTPKTETSVEVAVDVVKDSAVAQSEEDQMAAELAALEGSGTDVAQAGEVRTGSLSVLLALHPSTATAPGTEVLTREEPQTDAKANGEPKVPHEVSGPEVPVQVESPGESRKPAAPQPTKSPAAARRGGFKDVLSNEPASLSKTEGLSGIAIADQAAVTKFPHLTLGDKYHTTKSSAVKAGELSEGSLYKTPKPKSSFEQSTVVRRKRPT